MRQSHGVSSLAALIVQQVIEDFRFAPKDSAAYRTAKKFIEGGECTHIVCMQCNGDSWRTRECPPADGSFPCECGHTWHLHQIVVFDWTEHRDILSGSAGVPGEVLCGIIANTVLESTSPKTSSPTSKPALPKS